MVDKKLEDMAWNDEALHRIYLESAVFSLKRNKVDEAKRMYDGALRLEEDDYMALYQRSHCKRSVAETKEALKDAEAALALAEFNQPVNLAVCDALFDLNDLETCLEHLHTYAQKFKKSAKVNAFYDRVIVMEETLDNSLGDSLLLYFLNNETLLKKVHEEYKLRSQNETRPKWKISKEQGACDVLSILEKEDETITPCERARRDLSFKLFLQIYLNKNWSDFIFLKNLLSSPILLLPQAVDKSALFKKLLEIKTNIIWQFVKMLHTRGPIYSKVFEKCPIMKICEKQKEAHLYRAQQATRRKMFIILNSVRKYRKEKDLVHLSKCVLEMICNFILLKTRRLLCWKFVFVNEVLNVFALAHLDVLQVSKFPDTTSTGERLRLMFGHEPEQSQEAIKEFVFGDKSTFQDFGKFGVKLQAYRNRVAYLESKKRYLKFPIARAFMEFEIGSLHMNQMRIDECCTCARRSFNEARKCSNYAWIFLSLMLTAKAHAKLLRIERLRETLEESKTYVQYLRCERIEKFVNEALELNEILLKEKGERALSAMRDLGSNRSLKSRSGSSSPAKRR